MITLSNLRQSLLCGLFIGGSILSGNTQSAELWGEPLDVIKARIYKYGLNGYEQELKNDPTSSSFLDRFGLAYPLGMDSSNREFTTANKANIPSVSKDSKGNPYIELAHYGFRGSVNYKSAPKAVALPTGAGSLFINVELIAIKKLFSLSASTSYERSAELSWLDIVNVTSEKQWPATESVERHTNSTSEGTSQIDHGGKWVGFTSIEFGTADNVKLTTTICDIPTDPHEIKLKLFEYGVFVGTWRARYALVPESCQAGQIKAVAVSNVEPFTTLTDVVDFK